MKKRTLFFPLAVLLLILSCFLVLTACGDPSVTGIAVTKAPRTTYVLGQDLDLTGGILTVIVDGKESSVPLNAADVTVSGYNKDLLGKQTLTVTYKEKTTTFDVSVVSRMVAENYETNYFVGDPFDNTKGRLKITKDDGTSQTVNMNSPAVTVKSFNSEAAGDVTVTVGYSEGAGTDYEASFTVKVYAIGEVTITKPTKTAYQSHETELSLAGGYFTVKAAGLDTFSKFVNITPDMVVSGSFDPSLATSANRTTPLEQKVIYTYAGQNFEQVITITYSAISVMNDAAEALKNLDYTGSSVNITEEQGEIALDAITAYLALTKTDKNLVSEDTVKTVVLPAALYATKVYYDEAQRFSDTFVLDGSTGSMILVGKSYEQMAIDTAKLSDEKNLFNVYANLLRQMDEEFKDVTINQSVTVGDYIVIGTKEEVGFYIEVFKFLMSLHDTINVVPSNWKIEDLTKYKDDINKAVTLINNSGCIGPKYDYIFKVLANWREKNDYFDIIYSYYLYLEEDGADYIKQLLWQKLPLPGKLQDWYISLYNASYQEQLMTLYANSAAYLRDTTQFMYYYFETERIAEEIKNGKDGLYKELYALIDGDSYFDTSLRRATSGYFTNVGPMIKSDAFLNAWDAYLKLIKPAVEGKFNLEDYATEIEAAFNAVSRLSPTEMFNFLSSLNFRYANAGGAFYSLDYSNQVSNQFIYIISNYYLSKLPDSAKPLFQKLLIAMESFAIHTTFGTQANAYSVFTTTITELKNGYAALSAADKAVFDSLLGDSYSKYLGIYEVVEKGAQPTLNASAKEKLNEFKALLSAFIEIFNAQSNGNQTAEQQNQNVVSFFAIYERAHRVYNELIALNDENVMLELFAVKSDLSSLNTTLDVEFGNVRYYYVYYMLRTYLTEYDEDNNEIKVMLWDVYKETELNVFFDKLVDLLYPDFKGETADKNAVKAILSAFRALDPNDQWVLYRMAEGPYKNTLVRYFTDVLAGDDEAFRFAIALFDAETSYVTYMQDTTSQENKNVFIEDMAEAMALYKALDNTQLANEYLKEMYDYYTAKYNTLKG